MRRLFLWIGVIIATTGVCGSAPHRGEHNASVLADWLSLEDSQVRELAEAGVLLAE